MMEIGFSDFVWFDLLLGMRLILIAMLQNLEGGPGALPDAMMLCRAKNEGRGKSDMRTPWKTSVSLSLGGTVESERLL